MMEANSSGNYSDQELEAWDDKSHATLLSRINDIIGRSEVQRHLMVMEMDKLVCPCLLGYGYI